LCAPAVCTIVSGWTAEQESKVVLKLLEIASYIVVPLAWGLAADLIFRQILRWRYANRDPEQQK
jgi:hypothetical protein